MGFSDVLRKLFSKEQLPRSLRQKDYSQGLLCTDCRDWVKVLFRLQKELRTIKQIIVRTFRNTEENNDTFEIKSNDSDIEQAAVKKRMKLARNLPDGSAEKYANKSNKRQKSSSKPLNETSEIKLVRRN